MDAGWVAILVAGALLFLWGYGDSVAGSQKVAERAREMLHKERLLAMEKGLPPPDGSFDEALLAYIGETGQDALDPRRGRRQAFGWAMVLILLGVGWTMSTIIISQSSEIGWLSDTFSFGFIPVRRPSCPCRSSGSASRDWPSWWRSSARCGRGR
jgi:hypothetical protein